jgi:peptidoglycan hydrolase-like protein with peptidoglycan-binding domain
MSAPAPNLALGETSEWVLRLQTRLQALGLFTDTPDGTFGESTKASVVQLQEQAGLPGDGAVDERTWSALTLAEQQAGLQDPYAGGPNAEGVVDQAATPIGTLSEDQQWRWDGDQWQPSDQVDATQGATDEPGASRLSGDGQWVWDGNQWQPVT